MAIRTENLTILFVDIAGFTATTSRQSRLENADLLRSFERTLHPLVRAYKGTLVKSIGDALLLTFHSPTDAMLCAMALQDAMHGHNLEQSEDKRIHIRVAASLGEVRVANKDIFGEPVNVSARIEGVTPADEIWLSEAVYLAMNKAEVPAEEVGFKQLSGIPQAIRLYSIPRFATRRLVSEKSGEESGSPILYPYGGMHQRIAIPRQSGLAERLREPGPRLAALALGLIVLGLPLAWLALSPESPPERPAAPTPAASAPQADKAVPAVASAEPKPVAPAALTATFAPMLMPAPNTEPKVESKVVPKTEPARPESAAATPAAGADTGAGAPRQSTAKTPAKPAAEAQRVADKPAKTTARSRTPKPAAPAQAVASPPPPAAPPLVTPLMASANTPPTGGWNVIAAKQAYRAGRLSKPEYRQIIQRLEVDYENQIRQLKQDYRAGKLSRPEYDEKVRAAKLAYKGG